MSKAAHNKSSSNARQVACLLASLCVAALLLLLPRTQHALQVSASPAPSAHDLSHPPTPVTNDFWHTEGNRILDAHNRPVRIAGMNWSGFETKQAVPGGLGAQDYHAILRTIKKNGYNTVRIPFSNEMVETSSVPDQVSFSNGTGPMNTELRSLTSMEILDKIVAYSGDIGLKVILDNHRSDAGSSAQENGLWYTSRFSEAAWVEDWTTLALRYKRNSAVIGMDLRNEPHNADKGGACWDCGGSNDWHRAAQRAGNAVLAVNPRLLIFVEGVDSYAGDSYWWGGNLEGVRHSPVHLSIPDHLVYSAHEYGPAEYAQPWFNSATSASDLASIWHRHWAFISEAGIAPVWIGEFGSPNNDVDLQSRAPGSEGQWFSGLIEFLVSHPSIGWTYWGINGEDRYGFLSVGYNDQPANELKAEALESILGEGSLQASNDLTAGIPSSPSSAALTSTTYEQPPTSVSTARVEAKVFDTPSAADSVAALTHEPHDLASQKQKTRTRHDSLHAAGSSESSIHNAIALSIQNAVFTANKSLTRNDLR